MPVLVSIHEGEERMKRFGFITLLAAALTAQNPAYAESSPSRYNLGDVIVSATKTEIYQGEVGSSTSVVTSGEIEKSQKQTVQDVLRDMPGVSVCQNSAFGGTSSVYLRGAKPGQTLVLIDGIEVNDPMATDRAFDFAHLTTDNIERIEVVRGPQCTLYGSDAMAGVINIITKKGKGDPKVNGFAEAGSHSTFRENVSASGSLQKFNYSLSATRLDSDGINKASEGNEKDAYENSVLSSRLGYDFSETCALNLSARYTDSETDIDDGAFDDDPNQTAEWKDTALKLSLDQAFTTEWTHALSFSCHKVKRSYEDEADAKDLFDDLDSEYEGDTEKTEWQHNYSPVEWSVLTAGFEYEQESGSSVYRSGSYTTADREKTVDNRGYYLQNQFKFQDKYFITPGLRTDDHELFGTETTGKISSSILFETATRLKANWGTGFKAPSLYQLYSVYGDKNLNPDESESYDAGFEQSFFKDKVVLDVQYFHNDFKNMVDWDSLTYKYKNIGRARTNGFEAGLKYTPSETLTLGMNFTYTETEDKDTGLDLLRRPEKQTNFYADWAFNEKTNFNLGVTYVGSREDVVYDSNYNQVRIEDDSYITARLAASYEVMENMLVFGRIENLCDKEYEDAHGYSMPGASFYAGIKTDL